MNQVEAEKQLKWITTELRCVVGVESGAAHGGTEQV